MLYKGFYIHYHQDIGKWGIYRKNATALNVVQSVNLFNSEISCKKYIDKMC